MTEEFNFGNESTTCAVATPCVRGIKTRLPVLSTHDAERLLNVAQVSIKQCLQDNKFVFWLHWILRLPDPKSHRPEAPSDVAQWDQKEWSRITGIVRLFIGCDAGNKSYTYLAILLAHSISTWSDAWTRLKTCFFANGVPTDYVSSREKEKCCWRYHRSCLCVV